MMSSKRFVLALVLPFLLMTSVFGQERILSFDSDIQVAADGSMIVTETIRVRAAGKDIRRGIYRDFPTYYTNKFGFIRIVGFDVMSVTRDNNFEPWHIKKVKNGVRVFFGSEHVYLKRGVYIYRIRYKTTRQIGFFEDHDELYWNVTGNGWKFKIDQARATVTLPGNVDANKIFMEGYTGKEGSTDRAYTSHVMEGGASIKTTNLLMKEGLTLVMTWPKGVITPPGDIQRFKYFLNDNSSFLVALLTLIVVFIFLYKTWSRVGKDLKPGVIFPHYNPPKGYSPAASRYISEMKYDDKALTAGIVNLAVKGYLTIKRENGNYVLNKMTSDKLLAAGEAVLLKELFPKGPELKLEKWNRDILMQAKTAHEKALERDYLDIYFSLNSGRLWRSAVAVLGMFILTFVVGGVTGSNTFPVFIIPFVLIVILYIVFSLVMKSPSKKGRVLMDKLEGFKLYLDVAEQDDLNLRHPPEKTPELFERYLPFAIALGVEQAWAEQFTSVFAALNSNNSDYHPAWYVGDFNPMYIGIFALDISSSFTSTISSASQDPVSSSGSGAGGFSGGGGGGGGGGGW